MRVYAWLYSRLFPDLQAHDLRTRHGATQPQTLLIDKHGNKSFAWQLKRNIDVINLLLRFNFLLFTYAHLNERHNININNYNLIGMHMSSSTSRAEEPPQSRGCVQAWWPIPWCHLQDWILRQEVYTGSLSDSPDIGACTSYWLLAFIFFCIEILIIKDTRQYACWSEISEYNMVHGKIMSSALRAEESPPVSKLRSYGPTLAIPGTRPGVSILLYTAW